MSGDEQHGQFVAFMRDMAAECIRTGVFPAQQSQDLSGPEAWQDFRKYFSAVAEPGRLDSRVTSGERRL